MRISSSAILSLFVLFVLFSASCKKEQLLTSGGDLRFSTDTLTFDTVFTQTGSFTLGVKIFNPQDQKIIISSVKLEKGNASYFHLNVNGIPGNNVTDIEIAANDSIYVFATVNIDPNADSMPFIVEDRLIATMNGKEFAIPVYAFGQNAYYIVGDTLHTQTWKTDKPYVIIHSAEVIEGATLTIPAGARIYMNADSRLYVLGRLIVNGTKEDSVIFQGDRLDRAYFGYEGYPGEWGGIYFDSSSTGNKLSWTVLKNCGSNPGGGLPFAIEVFGRPGISTQLSMDHTIIENAIGYGLLCFQANVKAENSLIHDCGAQALAVLQGGTYSFDNCDFINYLPKKLSHIEEPTVAVLNYFDISNTEYWEGDLSADFKNCVIYGSIDNELFCNKKGNAAYNASFDHCLIQSLETQPAYVNLTDAILNQDPQFEDAKKWDFRPKTGSPLIDAGVNISGLGNDLDDKPRVVNGTIDIGCYEKQ